MNNENPEKEATETPEEKLEREIEVFKGHINKRSKHIMENVPENEDVPVFLKAMRDADKRTVKAKVTKLERLREEKNKNSEDIIR